MFGNDIFLCAKIDDTQSLIESIDKLDTNLKDESNESLLHYTVKFNSLEFARLLLMHNANINIKNNNGDTPLMIACKMGKENFIKLVKEMTNKSRAVAKIYKEQGDETYARIYREEAMSYQNIVWLLEDESYFNKVWANYMEK